MPKCPINASQDIFKGWRMAAISYPSSTARAIAVGILKQAELEELHRDQEKQEGICWDCGDALTTFEREVGSGRCIECALEALD